jgi:ABC-type bacteriocin/lantibiotic exporter with double-glycine peptidase domain
LLLGYYDGFEGIINYDGISIREYNKNSLFKRTGDNMLRKDVFEGTILENITLGDAFMKVEQVFEAITLVGLKPFIDQLPNGIHTEIVGGRMWLKDTIADKIILARAVVNRPELLVINENELSFNQEERLEVLSKLADPVHPWTLVVISKDREIMQMFSRILLFDQGKITFEGDLPALIRHGIPA